MILEPPVSVQKLQTALQAKAKEAPDYRFYLLYDKLYAKTFWSTRIGAARPMAAHRGWTAKTLRTSRRTGKSGGWVNWRTDSAGRRIGPRRYDVCGYRRRTAESARSASLVLLTGR